MRDHAPGYSPGGAPTWLKRKRWAKVNGRKGGLSSGRSRRALANGSRPPRARSREQALALHYTHRQPTRRQFEKAYAERFPRPERPSAALQWEKGRETRWMALCGLWRLYRACGQHAGTTNGQRGAYLQGRGRDRTRRTVQRVHRDLEALGYVKVHHYKDQRAMPGHKDHLICEIRTRSISHVTPPLRGSRNPPFRREVPTACPSESSICEAENGDLSPPPSAADAEPADERPVTPVTEREKLEAQLSFLQLKLDMGWTTPAIEADLVFTRAELRRLDDRATGAPEDPRRPAPD